ncbi:hypothetical protein XA68_12676 [Ophiocordyceps unilateralis]|uniref:Uncharacterized protein n=1 Tax=Ophiocordyceps unilateralis TaxID=268505 RepID=A0A2A9PE52_OPHUN|nr:hypothetical protein XA68_12676 [Ophiocordyceps unilateralis]
MHFSEAVGYVWGETEVNSRVKSRDPKTLASWHSIVDGALKVWTVCACRLDKGLCPVQVSGQAFRHTNWNVIDR